VKLFCLLYMLDIRFFRESWRSCTGEIYYAMADGPAPGTLRALLVMRHLDLDAGIGLLTMTDTQGPWPFDERYYSGRELEILGRLEESYANATSRELVLGDGHAWWKVYTNSRGVGAVIPYEMTLASEFAAENPSDGVLFTSPLHHADAGYPSSQGTAY
jgi:hypothetical protein